MINKHQRQSFYPSCPSPTKRSPRKVLVIHLRLALFQQSRTQLSKHLVAHSTMQMQTSLEVYVHVHTFSNVMPRPVLAQP